VKSPKLPKRIPPGTSALTIRQPWASLIIEGQKNIENRSRPTEHRGLLVIHAGLATVAEALDRYGHLLKDPDDLPGGAILGAVEITDCVENARSRWAEPGYFHWRLADPRPLRRPIPAKGSLGLWRVS
jgi:hypothetical protein